MDVGNAVAYLYDYAHRHGMDLEFKDIGEEGPAHLKVFTQTVVLDGKAYPCGEGNSKKNAKLVAAQKALECLQKDQDKNRVGDSPGQQHQVLDKNVAEISAKTKSVTNFTEIINHYCQKTNRLATYIKERRTGPPHDPIFFCKLKIDSKIYPVAEGKSTKDAAKQNAAKLAWSVLQEQSDYDSQVSVRSTESEDGAEASSSSQSDAIDSQESSSHNMQTTSSDSIVFAYSSNPSNAQMSRETGSGKNAPSPLSQDSGHTKSSLVISATSESIVFMDSSNPPKDQLGASCPGSMVLLPKAKTPVVKPKIKIAAIFPKVIENSKEDMINFQTNQKGNLQSVKSPTQTVSSFSRFATDYESIEQLDKGGFGRVFKAKRKLEEKYYAVKIVRYKEKTLEEVKLLSKLNHCNIVRYHSCWLEDTAYQWDASTDGSSASQSSIDLSMKYLYIQMELCEIKTLRVWIDEKNIQNPKQSLQDSRRREESVEITLQMVSGVDHIHSHMLIHRDLKPANIMFSMNGTVKIGDFGLVTSEIEDDAENQKERRGYKGTPSYMAPEQKEQRLYDRKVDIFALGLIFFELLWNIPTIHEKEKMWTDVRNQKLPQLFLFHFSQESQMIKLMLCDKPEERPEARKIKSDLEEHKCLLAELKTKQRDSKTVI